MLIKTVVMMSSYVLRITAKRDDRQAWDDHHAFIELEGDVINGVLIFANKHPFLCKLIDCLIIFQGHPLNRGRSAAKEPACEMIRGTEMMRVIPAKMSFRPSDLYVTCSHLDSGGLWMRLTTSALGLNGFHNSFIRCTPGQLRGWEKVRSWVLCTCGMALSLAPLWMSQHRPKRSTHYQTDSIVQQSSKGRPRMVCQSWWRHHQ